MLLAALVMSAWGCGEEEAVGEGTLSLEIWGEEYIEEEIPAADFEDGWGITYTKFLVNVSDIAAAQDGSDPSLTAPEAKIWDMTMVGPHAIAQADVEAGDYTHTAYVIAPADGTSAAGNAAPADVQLMNDNGYSVYVEGSATDGTVTKTFAWAFDTATTYDPCHSIGALEDGGTATIQLTIHGDHLFYDSAVSSDPVLRFAEIALADADGDDAVTQAELAAFSLNTLATHGVGSLDIDNMWDYIHHMTTTLGHIDGEGHCDMQ